MKTTTDPYLGRVSLVRVFSGTLRPDIPIHVSGPRAWPTAATPTTTSTSGSARSPRRWAPRCARSRPARRGTSARVARLASAETGDTLSSPEDPRLVPPWDLPTPQLPVAVEAASRADEDRLATALARLVAEDPTVRLERRPDTGQLLLWCVGEAHAEVLLERLRTRHGVAVNTVPVRVPMVETLAGPARVTGRHVKQSGGPRPVRRRRGRGRARTGRARASSSSRRSSAARCPASSTAAWRRASGRRPSAGISGDRPLVDVHVTLVDGKSHSVDSSDAAFQAAGALALRELAAAAGTADPGAVVRGARSSSPASTSGR